MYCTISIITSYLDFDFFQKIRLFFRVSKKRNKAEFFLAPCPHPLFFQNVPRFCFLRFMYPGTWIWRKNKIPCTWVYGFEPSSIYSWSIGHILEHRFFCLGHLGCAGSKRKKSGFEFFWAFFEGGFSTFWRQKKLIFF